MRYVWILLLVLVGGFRADNAFGSVNDDISEAIEQKFARIGPHNVGMEQYPVEDEQLKSFTVCFPAEIAQSNRLWPVVVYCNGTGMPVMRVLGLLEHLASWGFIAIGSEETMSGSGRGAIAALKFLLQQNELEKSIFYRKIAIDRIGIAGHSQGGAGAFNAVSRYPEGNSFKALFAVSPINQKLAASGIMRCAYDPTLLKLPVMLTASSALTGWDADSLLPGICGLRSMQNTADLIRRNSPVIVVIARLAGADKNHANALTASLPYMTAWFACHLQGDQAAGKFFLGDNPEIERNLRWKNVAIKKP